MEGFCRTCLSISSSLSTIFQDDLPSKIRTISSIEVRKGDKLSDKICQECVKALNVCYTFRSTIIKCDSVLKLGLSKGETSKSGSNSKKPSIHDNSDESNGIDYCLTIKIEKEDTKPKIEPPSEETQPDPSSVEEVFITDGHGPELSDENSDSPDQDKPSMKASKTKKGPNQCKQCDFQGKHPKDLTKHEGLVHKKFETCPICKGAFFNLKKHLIVHSTQDKSVTCPICKKVFKNMASYRNHPKDHIQEESTCEKCGKQFQFQGERLRHLYRHNKRKMIYTCETCGRTFQDLPLLKKHTRVHTGERPYLCSFCGKKYSSRWAMKTHMRQHTQEKPYKCHLCPMAFPQNVSLKTHLRSRH